MATPNQPNLNQTRQDVMDIAAMTEETFRSVADNIQSMFRDALDNGASLSKSFKNDIGNQIRSITRDSSKLADNFEKLNKGTLKQVDITKQLESRNAKLRSVEVSIQALRAQGTLESISLAQELSKEYDGMVDINKEFNRILEEQSQIIQTSADEVNKQLGFGPKLLGGLDKAMQKLGLPDLGFDDALKKTKEMAQAAKAANDTGFSPTKAYVGNIKDNLKGALTSTNLMQLGVGLLVEAFFKLDTMIGDTAKSMGISYQSAAKLNSEFVGMANNSGNIFVTTKGINESFNQINAALGTNGEISADILVTQTELVKQAGYSVEAATMLSKISLATGKPTKDIAANFLGQVKALNLINGTAINEKQLLEDISKVSKDTLATFANQPGKLAEAAYEARKLGLDLEKLKGTQSALLDIESSIASEFEAEVLTGKQLNLEKARYFSLTNDYAGLARELQKQDITRDSFAKMNVIQQEATAKALGMSAETMGGMLMDQEAMSKLSGVEGKNAKEKFDNLVKEVGLEEAKKRLGNDVLADQMASASIQDRFAASIEKLKELFITLMDPLMPILDIFSSIFGVVGLIMKVLDPMIQTALVGVAAIQDIVNGIKFLLGNEKAFDGGSAIVNQIGKAEVSAQQNYGGNFGVTKAGRESRVEDGIAPSSKGPFTITDKFGATTITTTGDGLAVSPNIQQTPSIKLPQQTIVQQSPSIDYDKMAQAMSRVQVQTNLDGVNVSRKLQTPMGIATRKL
jgi:hypothetical protein